MREISSSISNLLRKTARERSQHSTANKTQRDQLVKTRTDNRGKLARPRKLEEISARRFYYLPLLHSDMAGYLFFEKPSGYDCRTCGGMDWGPCCQSNLLAPAMVMRPGRFRGGHPRNSTHGGETPSPTLASLLDDILSQFFQPDGKKDDSSRPTGKCNTPCIQQKVWSEVIQLPPGFSPRNINDVTIQDGKVAIKLVKVTRDHLGWHSITAVRQIGIPEDIKAGSLKLVPLDRCRISVYGLKKHITDGKMESPPTESPKHDIEAETKQEKLEDVSSQEKPSDVDDTFEVIEKTQAAEEEKADAGACTTTCECDPDGECHDTEPCDCELMDERSCCSEADTCQTKIECNCKPSGHSGGEEKPSSQCGDGEETVDASTGVRSIKTRDQDFEQVLDFEPFDPADIKLRLSGSELLIDAVHRDEDDGNMSSFEMHRSLTIPKGVDLDQLKSRVSDTGKLVISAPYVAEKPRERFLTIQRQ